MGTAQATLDLARKYLGYREGPRNNQSIFGAYTGYNFQPWCGSFVKYVLDGSGVKGEPSPVYTPSGAAGYKAAGRWIPRNGNVQPGDVIFFDWQGGQSNSGVDHTGFVEAVLPGGWIQTIEGNTASGSAGNQSNGGGVYRRKRSRGQIAGFGRPAYRAGIPSPAPGNTPVDWAAVRRMAAAQLADGYGSAPNMDGSTPPGLRVVQLQRVLNLVSHANLAEDGQYGPATIQAVVNFQNFMNTIKPGTITDFPGAAHETTRWWLVTALRNIQAGK